MNDTWWSVEVRYGKRSEWEPIATFKYEVEAQAYVERHNAHKQAGELRKVPKSNDGK